MSENRFNGCEPIQELLSAHIDGELAADELRAVDTHLAACPRCRAERESLGAPPRLVEGGSRAPARAFKGVADSRELKQDGGASEPGKLGRQSDGNALAPRQEADDSERNAPAPP